MGSQGMEKTALLSECGMYRYRLTRGDVSNPLVFVMLNPSTADADIDDRTIESCLRFAEINNKTGLVVYNLYAFRSTCPSGLWKTHDAIGVDNDRHLREAAERYKNIVCAWGASAGLDRAKEVANIFKGKGVNLLCIGENKHGSPKHPLYQRAKKLDIIWNGSN